MLVTFSLLCHNHQRFIREAVRSVLAQDYEPLEILISDDHSTDATLDIIQEEIGSYTGPHSIRLIKHGRDVGWENCLVPPARHAESLSSVPMATTSPALSVHDAWSRPGAPPALRS